VGGAQLDQSRIVGRGDYGVHELQCSERGGIGRAGGDGGETCNRTPKKARFQNLNFSGAILKKILSGALAVGSMFTGSVAFAGQTDDVLARLDALEKENAAIRKENAALSENKSLRERNAILKSSNPQPRSAPAAPIAGAKRDPFGAYAADLPLTYKERIAETRGQFRIWAEGGAIWTGGDPISQDFALTDFTGSFPLAGGVLGSPTIPGSFHLTPKIGWEAATGFDYRFADSPWHVSGQFRYGEGGKTSGVASSAGFLNPALLALIPGGVAGPFAGAVIGGSETFATNYKENHWLADIAVGRDVFGTGPSAMQVKGGIRVAEFIARTSTSDNQNAFINFRAPVQISGPTGPFISAINYTNSTVTDDRNSFLGAGPRIGIEGSVPFAGNWAFDYLGDAAVLFGTQKSLNTTTTAGTITPAILLGGGSGGSINTFRSARFATVFNADIQVGVSYWLTQNFKVSASYRLDAFINVQNQESTAVTNLTPDRYTHGPRVGVAGQF
jgi:hypothetical protein